MELIRRTWRIVLRSFMLKTMVLQHGSEGAPRGGAEREHMLVCV